MVKVPGGKGAGAGQGKKEQAVRLPAGQGLEVYEDGRRSCAGTVVRFNTKKANHKIVWKEGNEWKSTRKDLRPPAKYALVERPEEERQYALSMAEEIEEEARSGGGGEGEIGDDGTSALSEVHEMERSGWLPKARHLAQGEHAGARVLSVKKGLVSQKRGAAMDERFDDAVLSGDSDSDHGRTRMMEFVGADARTKVATFSKKGKVELMVKGHQKGFVSFRAGPPPGVILKTGKPGQPTAAVTGHDGKKRSHEQFVCEVDLQHLALQHRIGLEDAIEDDLEARELSRQGMDEGAGVMYRDGNLLYAGLTAGGILSGNLGRHGAGPGVWMEARPSGEDGHLEARKTSPASSRAPAGGFSWQRCGKDVRSGRSRKPRGAPWMACLAEEAQPAELAREKTASVNTDIAQLGLAGDVGVKRPRTWLSAEGRVQQKRASRPWRGHRSPTGGAAGMSKQGWGGSLPGGGETAGGPEGVAAEEGQGHLPGMRQLANEEAELKGTTTGSPGSSGCVSEGQEDVEEDREGEATWLAPRSGCLGGSETGAGGVDGSEGKVVGMDVQEVPGTACNVTPVDRQATETALGWSGKMVLEDASHMAALEVQMVVQGAAAGVISDSEPAGGMEGAGAVEEKAEQGESEVGEAVRGVDASKIDGLQEGKVAEDFMEVGEAQNWAESLMPRGSVGGPAVGNKRAAEAADLEVDDNVADSMVDILSVLATETGGSAEGQGALIHGTPGVGGEADDAADQRMTGGSESEHARAQTLTAGLEGQSCTAQEVACDQDRTLAQADTRMATGNGSGVKEAAVGGAQGLERVAAAAAPAWRFGTGLGMRRPEAVGPLSGLLQTGIVKNGKYGWGSEMSAAIANGMAANQGLARGIPGALASLDNGVSAVSRMDLAKDERGLQSGANGWWQTAGSCSANGGLRREHGLSSDSSEQAHSRLCEGLAM